MKSWDAVPGWYKWPRYYEWLVSRYRGGTLVEVGTYLGRSLCHLGQLVKESGKPFRVVGVDTCLGSGVEGQDPKDNHAEAVAAGGGNFAGQLWGNVLDCGLFGTVSLVIGESVEAATLFPDGSLTAVFLDARHDYESVKADILAWLPKVAKDGVLAGDDYTTVWPGVVRAVNELLPGFSEVPHDSWSYEIK